MLTSSTNRRWRSTKLRGSLRPMDIGDRIKAARSAARLSQQKLGDKVNQAQTTISSWERGRTEPTRDDVVRLADALGTTVAALEGLIEESSPKDEQRPTGYPKIGTVGAGGAGEYADDFAMGAADDYIEPMPGMPVNGDIIVLDVDGDSMVPAVFDGDLAFFGPVRKDVDALLNKRVMARLADGRKFFKVLKRGTGAGLYTLRSLNPATPDIEDVQIEWVLPYQGSRAKGS